MWDERYSSPEYVFGTKPNAFLASCAHLLTSGEAALAIADGEGRNSVWLAKQGLQVTAFDASKVGIKKARKLAESEGVSVDYQLAKIEDWAWTPDKYDVVAAIFIQFAPPALRDQIFAGMKQTVKPGGLILMQGYRPEQIAYGTGGPGVPDQLYTEELLQDAFGDFEMVTLKSHDAELDEGPGHKGMSAVIDLIARKPL